MYILCNEDNKILVNRFINDITMAKQMADDYNKFFPNQKVTIYELKEVTTYELNK